MSAPRVMAGPRAQAVLYALAAVSYVAAGIAWKGLLNWIVGPLWLVAWAWGLPRLVELVRERVPGRAGVGGTGTGP